MKTHSLNVSYLVLGLVFLGIAGSWALRAADLVDTSDVQWLVPLSLVVAGVIGLVVVAAKGLNRRTSSDPAGARDDTAYGLGQQPWEDETGSTTYPTDETAPLFPDSNDNPSETDSDSSTTEGERR